MARMVPPAELVELAPAPRLDEARALLCTQGNGWTWAQKNVLIQTITRITDPPKQVSCPFCGQAAPADDHWLFDCSIRGCTRSSGPNAPPSRLQLEPGCMQTTIGRVNL